MTIFKEHPDFCIVGPVRTGTSWLDRALRSCTSIALPRGVKETFFFQQARTFSSVEWRKLYAPMAIEDKIFGEVSPTYFTDLEAMQQLALVNPRCKVIVVVRDPVERAFSHFRHEVDKGRCVGNLPLATETNELILEASRYSIYLPKWIEKFGEANTLVIFQESISQDPDSVLSQLSSFLGCGSIELSPNDRLRHGVQLSPRLRWLALVGSWSARLLRTAKLHEVVEFLKNLGLRKIYYGGAVVKMSEYEKAYLEDRLVDEGGFVSRLAVKHRVAAAYDHV